MYPIDRRRVATHIYSLLQSLRKTGILLQVSHTTVARWLKGSICKKKVYEKVKKSELVVDVIKTGILNNPFISIIELQDIVVKTLNVQVSRELIRRAIARQGLTKKKARMYGISTTQKEKTQTFLDCREKFQKQQRRFVSIDETSFGRSGLIVRGYSMKGTKLYVKKKCPRMTTTSVVACVSEDGLVHKKALKGAFNTQRFLEFLAEMKIQSGTVVLLDNVSFHHSRVIQDFADERGIDLLFVPPYSPWFNPIEMCFSVVKKHFYQHQDIELAFSSLSSNHCRSFFNKSLNLLEGPF